MRRAVVSRVFFVARKRAVRPRFALFCRTLRALYAFNDPMRPRLEGGVYRSSTRFAGNSHRSFLLRSKWV